jgi:SAM-dependent methyltransferase
MVTAEETKALYTKAYHTKCGHVNTDGLPSVSTEKAVECAGLLYELFKPASVLDCGCATGWLAHGFLNLDKDIKVAGFDISEYVINHAYDDLRDKLIILDIASGYLPYADGEFDLVLCFDVLEHLANYEELYNAANEISRISNRWIILRQPMVRFIGLEGHKEIAEWLATLNVLPNKARLALVGVADEVVPTSPEPDSVEHPNGHPRQFWIELFKSCGYEEWELPEFVYHMPNVLHIHSFDTLVLTRNTP